MNTATFGKVPQFHRPYYYEIHLKIERLSVDS